MTPKTPICRGTSQMAEECKATLLPAMPPHTITSKELAGGKAQPFPCGGKAHLNSELAFKTSGNTLSCTEDRKPLTSVHLTAISCRRAHPSS